MKQRRHHSTVTRLHHHKLFDLINEDFLCVVEAEEKTNNMEESEVNDLSS